MNKLKILVFIIIFISASTYLNFAQQKNSTVATIGKDKITSEEFTKRYELTPHLDSDEFNSDSTRYDLLYSLIAEDLWAQKAKDLGYDTTDYYKNLVHPMENLYVRDALFKKEIDSKIKYSKEDIHTAIERSEWTLRVNIISAADSETIFNIYSELKHGASFDSLLMLSNDSVGQKSPLAINYGDMRDDVVEDTLYSMKVGNFSYPLKTYSGWFIFKLRDKVESPRGAYTDEGSVREEVMRSLKEKKARDIGEVYIKNLMAKQKIMTDIHLFRSLVYKIIDVVDKRIASDSFYKNHWLTLHEDEIKEIMNEFGPDSLKMPFIKFEKNPSSLKEFLNNLQVDLFTIVTPVVDFDHIANILLAHVNYFIRQESLAREGYRQGLQNEPGVKADLKIWEKSYLSKIFRNTFYDSLKVTDDEIQDFFNSTYKSQNSIEEVNIQEILNSKLDVMETVLEELKKGKDFGELAKMYTERKWTKNKNGEFGFFPVTMYGPIGKAAAKMKIGEIYGPIATDEGYSIFKLIGKKEKPENGNLALSDSIKSLIKDEILKEKWDKKINSYTVSLAKQYGFKIFDNTLKDLKLSNINMFTYRYMGFGGRITAVPYLVPWYDWYKLWNNQNKNIVP